MVTILLTQRRGCWITLAEHNKNIKLELPRTLKLLDSSKSSQYCEGSSSHDLFSYGNKVGQERF